MNQIKQLLLTGILLLCVAPVFAQAKKGSLKKKSVFIAQKKSAASDQLTSFLQNTAQANVAFNFPPGFKEIKAPDNEDYSFDYAMELPGQEFEIWLQVRSQKENYASYQNSLDNRNTRQANPDSVYIGLGNAHAIAFSGSRDLKARNIPYNIAARYNADAGKSYLLTLPDLAVTKHYKYALLVTLQKDRTGTIMAVCFGNEKGPEFFKNMDRASNCVKFKQ
ncbi:hypothetical protein [Mucilaginibacter sp.]|uniref:hypothetical protein n=1 Tax=Mucilaginibacter sp. TaxID=1882438 RepID=UPI0035BC51E5